MTLFDLGPSFSADDDPEIELVGRHLLSLDPQGTQFATVLRSTIDQLLDGEHTGRYDWQTLHKTEKTHAGTLVEINLQRKFGFASHADDNTIHMDYLIEGIEVDCKFSQRRYGWMIPPEALGEVCLVVWADDHQGRWGAGLFRADRTELTESAGKTKKGNRDGKFHLTQQHHHLVRWLWQDRPLKENLLLHLDPAVREAIMTAAPGKRDSGQARVNELFRRVHRRQIDREVIRTLGRQHDYMARVREDTKGGGRARTKLRAEGIIILGPYRNHQQIAVQLGGPYPRAGEFVAFRVRRARPEDNDAYQAEIGGAFWVAAAPGEQTTEDAPVLPAAQGTVDG
ncbi:NaeI family type II restriction endonuclease [Streptacidiphilus sp. N1-3]|uniref:NaeI family type II restriction endonuclease n=1 Tax=Streptacidiphilus alkalitolerans TaxID=3342712 RepID=A0ABV6WVP3_9ACTN